MSNLESWGTEPHEGYYSHDPAPPKNFEDEHFMFLPRWDVHDHGSDVQNGHFPALSNDIPRLKQKFWELRKAGLKVSMFDTAGFFKRQMKASPQYTTQAQYAIAL